MRKVEITLDEDIAEQLEEFAARNDTDLSTVLSQRVRQHFEELLEEASKEWMPRPQWDALVKGEGCPLCDEMASDASVNKYGYTIADLRVSRLRLMVNQFVPGYCVLIYNQHVREPYELPEHEQRLFFDDLMAAAKAIEQVFQPIKMNFELLGNTTPHLHSHLVPRYYGDPAPGTPINPDLAFVLLTPDEYTERAQAIQEALTP